MYANEYALHASGWNAALHASACFQIAWVHNGDLQPESLADRLLVAIDARESNSSVANIAQLDMVKRNVQSASSTLAEATELSSLFVKVGAPGPDPGLLVATEGVTSIINEHGKTGSNVTSVNCGNRVECHKHYL
eukprot:303487-Pelagomonas_calceolata.AAC.2